MQARGSSDDHLVMVGGLRSQASQPEMEVEEFALRLIIVQCVEEAGRKLVATVVDQFCQIW